MAITLKAYCSAGSKVLLIDPNMGGHSSTAGVAKHLGISPIFLPYTDTSKLDVDRLARVLRSENISLIYLDQSNCLFPVDVSILRNVITDINSETKLHVDTSHINGLILGGALENPLRLGADSFGGSFHKSFPGPHKGFFATNDPRISKEFSACANLLVSHHHAGEMLALAVSLIEFECCGGAAYARQMVTNAQAFGRVLSTAGLTVAGADGNFTKTHQVWVINDTILDGTATSQRLYEAGLIVNSFGYLPGFPSGGVRLGLNEVTRYGLLKEHSEQLAAIFADVVSRGRMETNQRLVTSLRKQFSEPAYCFTSMEF
jgi:glycine/serine hydroxymethyltransferase